MCLYPKRSVRLFKEVCPYHYSKNIRNNIQSIRSDFDDIDDDCNCIHNEIDDENEYFTNLRNDFCECKKMIFANEKRWFLQMQKMIFFKSKTEKK